MSHLGTSPQLKHTLPRYISTTSRQSQGFFASKTKFYFHIHLRATFFAPAIFAPAIFAPAIFAPHIHFGQIIATPLCRFATTPPYFVMAYATAAGQFEACLFLYKRFATSTQHLPIVSPLLCNFCLKIIILLCRFATT